MEGAATTTSNSGRDYPRQQKECDAFYISVELV